MSISGSDSRSPFLAAVLLFVLFMSVFVFWFSTLFIAPFEASLTPPQVVAGLMLALFWVVLPVLVFGLLLSGVTSSFISILRERLWAKLLFPAYLAVHLVVYGVVLEKIIVLSVGQPPFSLGAQAYAVINYYFLPHTLLNGLLQITQNPGIVVIIPPFYGLTLGPFAVFSAVLIGVLVIVHTDRLIRVSSRLRRAGGTIVYPVIGIIGGASCCISLPDIAASASPFAVAIFTTPLWTNLLYVLYYLLPISVIVAFVLTLRPMGLQGKGRGKSEAGEVSRKVE